MSTVNGIGKMFYGWQHEKDGISVATEWFTFFYIPIFPLRRQKLKVLVNFENEKFLSNVDHYKILENLPLNFHDILMTYLRTYVLLPILMCWPIVLIFLNRLYLESNPAWKDSVIFKPVVIAIIGIILINIIAVPMWAIQKARGYKGGFFKVK